MKAAGHELKAAMRYYRCDHICVPLVALIDYRGFRLVAESLLPIKSSTIVYGSSDGGRTVHDSNPRLNRFMEEAARKINIKPHLCGMQTKKKLAAPVDIEGHVGFDNRFYGDFFHPKFRKTRL